MPDVMFTGPEGRLEGRYHQSKEEHAPIALILHPHPQYGGTMNHKVVFSLFHVFVNRGFSVRLEGSDPYLRSIRDAWGNALHKAFEETVPDPGWIL